MKCVHVVLLAICLLLGRSTSARSADPAIGDRVTRLEFKDIRALTRSLSDLGEKRAYVFVFTTTSCPLVRRSIPKLVELDARLASQGVQFVAINVGTDDTIRDMAAQAIELNAAFPFVKDTDLSCVAALGVKRTPEVAVLDSQHRLVYRGRIDDQLRLGGARPAPTRKDLELALTEILAGTPVTVPETPVDGCVIESRPSSQAGSTPTYHADVAPILTKRCTGCHAAGQAAPFALESYEQAAAHAAMIAEVTEDQRMPPWYANPRHGKFQNDPTLSREERQVLKQWAQTGRAAGTASEAVPESKAAPTGWRIGEPDLVITMLEEHTVPASGFVPYRHVLLPHVFFGDTWLEAIEIRPSNPAVVHHCNMAYANSSGVGHETFITGYVPGGQAMDLGRFENNVAFFVPRLSVVGLQIHYTTTGKEEKCRISVGFRFPRRNVQKQLRHVLLDPHRIAIAPGHGAFPIQAQKTLDRDIDLLGLFTHMHVRGKDMTFTAIPPEQPREILLQIPNYNFEWQLGYEIKPGTKHLPRGTVLEAVAHYDNSTFNPYNPDPTRTVPWGQQTYDEMFNGYIFFVDRHEQLNLTIDPKSGQARRSRPKSATSAEPAPTANPTPTP